MTQEKQTLCKNSLVDTERKKESIKESAGKSETFVTFPVNLEGKKRMQTIPPVYTKEATCEENSNSQDCLCSSIKSLPYPVSDNLMVSEKSKKSQIQFKFSSYETKSSDIIKKRNSECFNTQNSRSFSPSGRKEYSEALTQSQRPLSPSVKNIGDQTAKAALIRTLITERLNSCSPVSWQT